MIDLENKYHAMSTKVMDGDGGWWNHVKTGNEIRHRMPNIGNVVTTVDIIVKVHDQLLLIKRGKDPYKDAWAFPGGRVEDKDEDLESAAMRELREETNIEIDREQLKQIVTVGNNKRDPRGFCTTIVYLLDLKGLPDSVKAGDDAVGYKWFKLTDLPDMAFDHREILSALDEK
jgi:8-oxo-dGTP diphosphatase